MTLVAVLSGIVVVLATILWLKLPAFLALLAGAVTTGVLTDRDERLTDAIGQPGVRVVNVDGRLTVEEPPPPAVDYTLVSVGPSPGVVVTPSGTLGPGSRHLRSVAGLSAPVAAGEAFADRLRALDQRKARPTAVDLTESMASGMRYWLVPTPKFAEVSQTLNRTLGQRLSAGFGKTAGSIGLIVALAAVIGQCLLHSGAADTIVRRTLAVTGESGAPAAFVGSGFLLGIPVFFDTVFYLMIPLGKALHRRTGVRYLTYVLTIVCGGTMAHSLVPPTPGPLLVASELGVPIATMIGFGCGVGLVTAVVGYAFAMVVGGRADIRPPEETDHAVPAESPGGAAKSPGLVVSLLPIGLPVALITLGSLSASGAIDLTADAASLARTLGDRNIALLIAAAFSLGLLRVFNRSGRPLADVVTEALLSGAMIVLITGAGGAFGLMLREAGLRSLIGGLPPAGTSALLCLAFLVTAGIRTAQGSATVAMITAVALFADLGRPEVLGCHPVYLALAIGCGSKPLAWMNDSGFWVITRMSGLTPQQGLRYVTPMTALMGLAGLATTVLLAAVCPMV